jgi:hypothetical protein
MNRDVIALLGEARPAGLDPAPDTERRARDLHDAMAGPFEKRRTARPRRRLTIGFGVVAVGAAASVAVATVGHGTRAPSTPTVRQTELSARQVLLAAANTAEKEPVGRYWRVHYVGGQGYRVGGAGAGGYQVYLSDEFDRWTPGNPDKDDQVIYGRGRPSGPLTAADRAAWRKAGSPDHWRVTSNGDPLTLTRKAEPWNADRTTPAERARSLAEMRKMCASPPPGTNAGKPCEKAKVIENSSPASGFEAFEQRLAQSGGSGSSPLMTAYDFLTGTAVAPADRAKAFRLLAGLPGVRVVGAVRDAYGRPGIGLSASQRMRDGSGTLVDYQLILDPKTYEIRGDQKVVVTPGGHDRGMRPGTVHMYDVILFSGWTNDSPHHA